MDSTNCTPEWSEEICIQLIREYRKKPALWDPKDPFFAKKIVKTDNWREIGEALDLPPDACKHKMVVLMSSFRREKAKILQSMKSCEDPSDIYRSTWFGFKEMAFLIDKEGERKRQLTGVENDDDNEQDGPSSLKKAVLQHHFQPPISKLKNNSRSHGTAVKKQLMKIISKHAQEENMMQSKLLLTPTPSPGLIQSLPPPPPPPPQQQQTTDTTEMDEIKCFTNFIANKMKKYSETTKNSVQQAICEIIFKADQKFYEAVSYDNYDITIQSPHSMSEGGVHDPLDKSVQSKLARSIKIDDTDSD